MVDTSKYYGDKGKFLHEVLGDDLIEYFHICYIRQTGQENEKVYKTPLYYYDKGEERYIQLNKKLFDRMAIKLIKKSTISGRKEAWTYVEGEAPIKDEADSAIIGLKNCNINVLTGEQYAKSPDLVVRRHIPITYDNTTVTCDLVNAFFKTLFGDRWNKTESFIYEIMGYPLLASNRYGKIFFLIGEGGNGKSSLLSLIRLLFGANNCSSVPLIDIDRRFSNVGLYNKIVNLGDDIGGDKENIISKSETLKKLATGEEIQIERKFQEPVPWIPTIKLFFSANKPPVITDKTQAIKDRLIVIPFLERIRFSSLADPHIMDKLNDDTVLSYLFNKSMEGLQRLVGQGQFSIPQYVQDYTLKYHQESSYVYQFIQDVNSGDIKDMGFYSYFEYDFSHKVINQGDNGIEDYSKQALYDLYKRWCNENGFKPFNNSNFKYEMGLHGYKPMQRRKEPHRGFKHYGLGSKSDIDGAV